MSKYYVNLKVTNHRQLLGGPYLSARCTFSFMYSVRVAHVVKTADVQYFQKINSRAHNSSRSPCPSWLIRIYDGVYDKTQHCNILPLESIRLTLHLSFSLLSYLLMIHLLSAMSD